MAINEQIVTGQKFRSLMDEAAKLWQRISFWTKASDVEFDDGLNAETKVGAINGITDSLASTSSHIAASAKAVHTLNSNLVSDIYVGNDGKLHKVQGGADTALPFNSALEFATTALRAGSGFAFNVSGKTKLVLRWAVTERFQNTDGSYCNDCGLALYGDNALITKGAIYTYQTLTYDISKYSVVRISCYGSHYQDTITITGGHFE